MQVIFGRSTNNPPLSGTTEREYVYMGILSAETLKHKNILHSGGIRNRIITRVYDSPCGTLILGSCKDKLCLCDWQAAKHREYAANRLRRLLNAEFMVGTTAVIDAAVAQLDEYFARTRHDFDIPLMFAGTEFQKKVWNALLGIPYGTTISYGELARRIGMPKAIRAIANANGANVISIFAPCHRVIGSDHSLTGYSGGVAAKEYLLNLENDY